MRGERRRTYYEDGEGRIAVYNAYGYLWFRWTPDGYEICGRTRTPEGATKRMVTA